MNDRDHALIYDIRQAALKIESYLHERIRADLESNNELIGFAVCKAIEVIGEAANHLSADFLRQTEDLPWAQVVGMRNLLIHGYAEINYDIVWRVATEDLPALIRSLEQY